MRRELILESFNCSPNLFWDWGWSMLMRFITQLGDGKGFYGEDNDRRDLPWCNAVKHPESSRNHLLSQVSVQSQSGFRIWFLWTQDGGGGGGNRLFSSLLFCKLVAPFTCKCCKLFASSRHSVASKLNPFWKHKHKTERLRDLKQCSKYMSRLIHPNMWFYHNIR